MNCLLNTNFDELNDKEVRELISEYLETGNEEIRNKITYSYSKHVYRIAEGMVRGSLTVEDLFQEGIVALWKCTFFMFSFF